MWQEGILYGSFCAAFVIVGVRALMISQPYTLSSMMVGQGKFDYKASWASNTTLFGAVLAGALKDGFTGKLPTSTWSSEA